jgi:hypothetical protein
MPVGSGFVPDIEVWDTKIKGKGYFRQASGAETQKQPTQTN